MNLTFDICANRRNILRIVSLFAWCRRYHRHHRHRVHHLQYTQNLFCTNSILQLFINIKLYESEKERERVQLSRRRCIRKYVRFLSYWCIPSSQQHMHNAHSFFTLFDLKWISTCWHDTCTYVSVRKWTNRRKKRWNCRQLIYALLAILCTQNTVLLHSINILWSTNIFTITLFVCLAAAKSYIHTTCCMTAMWMQFCILPMQCKIWYIILMNCDDISYTVCYSLPLLEWTSVGL